MKNVISTVMMWFWLIWMVPSMLLLSVVYIMIIYFGDIPRMINSGYATYTIGLDLFLSMGLLFAIMGLVPAFRRCYFKLPWLYSMNVFLLCNLFIAGLAEEILAKGYEKVSTARHIIAIVIVIIQIIGCRIVMSYYFKKHPFVEKREKENGKD